VVVLSLSWKLKSSTLKGKEGKKVHNEREGRYLATHARLADAEGKGREHFSLEKGAREYLLKLLHSAFLLMEERRAPEGGGRETNNLLVGTKWRFLPFPS